MLANTLHLKRIEIKAVDKIIVDAIATLEEIASGGTKQVVRIARLFRHQTKQLIARVGDIAEFKAFHPETEQVTALLTQRHNDALPLSLAPIHENRVSAI